MDGRLERESDELQNIIYTSWVGGDDLSVRFFGDLFDRQKIMRNFNQSMTKP